MNITNETARYDLSSHMLKYGGNQDLLITDLSGNEITRHSLKHELVFIQVEAKNGGWELQVGKGVLAGERFTRALKKNAGENTLRVFDNLGIGIGDERDVLRVMHEWCLDKVCIAVESTDGDLRVHCPGNPTENLSWYRAIEGNPA